MSNFGLGLAIGLGVKFRVSVKGIVKVRRFRVRLRVWVVGRAKVQGSFMSWFKLRVRGNV